MLGCGNEGSVWDVRLRDDAFSCKIIYCWVQRKAPLRTLNSVSLGLNLTLVWAVSVSILDARMVAAACLSYRVPGIESEATYTREEVTAEASNSRLLV